ncbi:hybrid sensor histidine kinase/response regulator [Rubellicoccus peritrichatus]|uniref:histidine kinase n=1 Tax=Rubellicoccus peritrichatus TaxID=3080537 RepID=A0AAQ3LCT6_9BACT|nr:hybrid sensor histidine kinase/response regulator [Puniceicoccus sp. CR14]WOO43340.1 hybrid sensor histidine kinase/response regulator [Puniceicoccus sp. CR14]
MKPSIVVADENPTDLEYTASILEMDGYTVFRAQNGQEALDLIERHEPTVICCDLVGSETDSMVISQRLRSKDETQSVPIVIVTGEVNRNQLPGLLEAGASDFMTKPVSSVELRARVRTKARIHRQYQEVAAAHRMREDLSHMLTHDLRGNLSIVQMATEFLRRDDSREVAKPLLNHLEQVTKSMSDLLNELLVEVKLQGGVLRPRFRRHDFLPILRDAVAKYELPAAAQGVMITEHFADVEQCEISADPDLLSRVLDNLLSNAIRYAPERSVVKVSLELEDEDVLISVCDEGAGIPDGEKPLVFKKFFSGRSGSRSGTGLGLAFCRLVIEAHNGKIEVLDNAPRGARVAIRLNRPAALTETRRDTPLVIMT